MDKEQLQIELTFVDNELAAERQKGAEGDVNKIKQLEQKRADINYQLDGINKAEKEQAIEERVHSEAVPFAIEGVDFKELPAALITIIEKVVKADRRRIYAEHAIELEQVENERDKANADYSTIAKDYASLEEEYNTVARELKEQAEETVRLIAERDDARTNRDNAAAQLAEANAEIARLKSEVEDYQKAKVYGERQAQAVIDVTPTEAEEINDAIKQFLTSEDWGSIIKATKLDGTFELVKREEFNAEWQPITPPQIGGGETATETFQDEAAEGDASNGGILAPEVPGIDFRTQEESTATGLDEHNSLSEGDAPVTRREFQELSARVAQLEQSKVAVA